MSSSFISIEVPALMDFVPVVREYISDILISFGCSEKFSYRSEIVVDELCVNAIRYGSASPKSRIGVSLSVENSSVTLAVRDEGARPEEVANLREEFSSPSLREQSSIPEKKLGLEIVRMLSENIEVLCDGDTVTRVSLKRSEEVQ